MDNNTLGVLTVVATPIGNLGDITPRAVETLAEADVIAAEDTRRTLQLLNHLGIKNNLISYYRHNEEARVDYMLSLLEQGQNIALVSDAGTPGISDPGQVLIQAATEAGYVVTMAPGPAACIQALVLSGMDTNRFTFEGFLPLNKKNRRARMAQLANETRTMIFYEAPHKLVNTLEDMQETWGAERRIALCRELTKLHEEIIRVTIGEALAMYEEVPPKGEFVIVVAGGEEVEETAELTNEGIVAAIQERIDAGMRLKDASKEAAKALGIPARDAYQIYIDTLE